MACSGHCHNSTKSTVAPRPAKYLAQQMGRWLSWELNGMAQATMTTFRARRSSGRIMVSMGSSGSLRSRGWGLGVVGGWGGTGSPRSPGCGGAAASDGTAGADETVGTEGAVGATAGPTAAWRGAEISPNTAPERGRNAARL